MKYINKEGLLLWLPDSMPALRPGFSDFYLLVHQCMLLSLPRIQLEEAITRASDTFVLILHAELSRLRQDLCIITVPGTLEAWDLTISRAPLRTSIRDTRPPNGSAAADAYA